MSNHHGHDHGDPSPPLSPAQAATAVLEVKGLHWAGKRAILEITLGRLAGVRTVEANPSPRQRPPRPSADPRAATPGHVVVGVGST